MGNRNFVKVYLVFCDDATPKLVEIPEELCGPDSLLVDTILDPLQQRLNAGGGETLEPKIGVKSA